MGLKETFFQILPVFLLMGLGGLARQLGYLTRESIPVLNMLTYYMAIPVMIFLEISKYDLRGDFDITPVFLTCFAVLPTALFAYILGKIFYRGGPTLGSFVQSSIHGNLGYLGLAVSYYVTGSQGLVKTSLFAGFLIIVQNVVSVVALLTLGSRKGAKSKWGKVIVDILLNPIIIAAASGILYSAFKVYIPSFLKESMVLLSRMALPLALLVIGASISLNLLNLYLRQLSMAVLFKLVFLPGLGICLLWVANTPLSDIYPAVILLSSPTATVSYVMATQMGGDASFSTAAISVSTALSILTYTLWVWLMGYLPLR